MIINFKKITRENCLNRVTLNVPNCLKGNFVVDVNMRGYDEFPPRA